MILICHQGQFRPVDARGARWLALQQDYALAAHFWATTNAPLTWKTWREANEVYRYTYAAIVLNDRIIAIAASLPFSPHAWDVSAVKTHPDFRRQGYGKAVVSYVAKRILDNVHTATCNTSKMPMVRTCESLGFTQAPHNDAQEIAHSQRNYFNQIGERSQQRVRGDLTPRQGRGDQAPQP
jgi:GNAT superfamily N-acetyltransferase